MGDCPLTYQRDYYQRVRSLCRSNWVSGCFDHKTASDLLLIFLAMLHCFWHCFQALIFAALTYPALLQSDICQTIFLHQWYLLMTKSAVTLQANLICFLPFVIGSFTVIDMIIPCLSSNYLNVNELAFTTTQSFDKGRYEIIMIWFLIWVLFDKLWDPQTWWAYSCKQKSQATFLTRLRWCTDLTNMNTLSKCGVLHHFKPLLSLFISFRLWKVFIEFLNHSCNHHWSL